MANSEDVIVPADLEDDVAGSASALRVSPWCAPWLWSAVKVVLLVLLWHTFSTALSLGAHGSGHIASHCPLQLLPRARHPHLLLHVVGETEFELLGFIFVMLASFMAGLRWVLLQVLLQPQLHSACVLCLLSHTPQSSGFSPFLAYLLWSRHPHATISFPVLLVPLASHQPQVRPPSTPTGLTNPLLTLLQYLAPVMALVCGIFSLLHEPWSSLASLPYFDTWPHSLWTLAVMPVGGVLAFCMVGCRATRHVSLKAIGCTRSVMSSSLTTRGQALGPTLAAF
ncbi:unnamed protein product [Closterium sp. NIES-65]|nr:unnamed protein product [Closterium sp. NIES-65]